MLITIKTKIIPIKIWIPNGVFNLKIIKKRFYKNIDKGITYEDFNKIHEAIFKEIKKYKGFTLVDIYSREDKSAIKIKI